MDNIFLNVFKGVLISIIFTIVSLTIFALLLVNTDMSENLIQPVIIGVTGVSIMLGSCMINKKRKKRGILNGCVIGVLYICILYLASSVANEMNFSMNLRTIGMATVGIIGGAVGGIIGVNL